MENTKTTYDTKIKEELVCTRCKSVQETYSELVYSQGDLVCLNCKEELLESDKKAFDRDMMYR